MHLKKNLAAYSALWNLGCTQRELAKKVELSYTTINQIFNGRIVPRQEEKERIARELKATVDEIFGKAE